MQNLILEYQAVFSTKIGRCAKCMRQSFTVALAAWGVFGIGLMILPNSMVQNAIGIMALGLTALWMLHVVAYALRAVMPPTKPDIDPIGRRRTLGFMLRAAGIGVVASTPALLWPTKVLAFCGQCTKDDDCGVGWSCKNTAAVNSGEVCNECVQD